ncbi:hypothetical protein V2J09_021934 [Rumex salicifolius]
MNPNPAKFPLIWRGFLSPLLFLLSLLIPTDCLNRDGVLLLSFRYGIIGDPLNLLSGWSYNDDNPCNWRGVACSPAGDNRVTALSLPNSQLRGSISSNLGFLDQLRTLNLSSNSLYGSLETDFFRLSELRELDLSNNLISGELPRLIGQFQNLQFLNLSRNVFVGEFPSQLAGLGNLTVISATNNNLSGSIPTGLDRVRVLDLASNFFNGSLSPGFGGQSIQYFNLSNNRISGEIPADFGKEIPENATLDFSYNNLTGDIPDSRVFLEQETASFSGNPGLCGGPLSNPCPIPSSPTSLPTAAFSPNSSPAIAAMPNNINSQPADGAAMSPPSGDGGSGLKPVTIAVIVAGDLAGILILALVLFLVYRLKRNRGSENKGTDEMIATRTDRAWSSPSSLTSSETKGFTKWSCLRTHRGGGGGGGGDADDQSSMSSSEEETNSERNTNIRNAAVYSKDGQNDEQIGKAPTGTLVTVDGENELEVETLLKASAFILGASGPSIVYKAVLEDGSALAVRRIGEGAADRLKDFESQVRSVAKVAASHPNLVRIRGFYWAADEKLIIYEFVPNGSLANARYRKGGSSPCHLPWEYRLKIAKGVARGLSYLHDKKHVHGNLKPSNILLDLEMEPKIADFGLDRLAPGLESGHKTGFSTRHFGSKRSTCSRDSFQDAASFGPSPSPSASSIGCGSPYCPPESLRSLKPNAKWDSYAFGVVLIELLTGRVLGPDDLATWMVGLNMGEDDLQENKTRVLRMADLAIRADLEGMEDALLTCLKLGCGCANPLPHKRPSMKEALQVLEKLPTSFSSPYF